MSNLILSILSGILLGLSFPKPQIAIFAWFGFVFLFTAVKKASYYKEAFLLSFISGLVFFGITAYWIIHVSFIGAVFLLVYLAFYFGVFGLGFKWIENHFRNIISKSLLIACFWTALELLRSHLFTGFGWALLGYSQYKLSKLIQIADITGVYGISFLLMFINVSLFNFIQATGLFLRRGRRLRRKYDFLQVSVMVVLCAAFIFIFLSYSQARIRQFSAGKKTILKVSVVQGNISQDIKWDKVLADLIFSKYERFSQMADFDEPDIIIWPETSLPGYLNEEELMFRISKLSVSLNTPFLIGAARFTEDDLYYNSAAFFDNEGRLESIYDKTHLVPFGEYIPLRFIFSPITFFYPIADFAEGKEYHLFNVKKRKFGVLICFEDVFPDVVRQFVKRGADFMVNITNDAWFKKSSAAYQHNQALVFRAVENKVSMARCGNTGPSLFIEPTGVIKSRLANQKGEDLFIDGFLTAEISGRMQETFYTKFGNLFAYACAGFFIAWFVKRRP